MQTPKARATAKRISDAAAALFAERGFDDTTIASVAQAAGVAPGTVMLHFGTKPQLATAAFADQIRGVVDAASGALAKGELLPDLEHFVRPIYGWYSDNERFAPDLLREALFSDGPWAGHYEQTVGNTVAAFAEIVVRNDGPSPVADVAEGLLADYLLVLLRSFRQPTSVDDQVGRFLELAATRIS